MGEQFTNDDLVQWLHKQYEINGKIQDRDAGMRIRSQQAEIDRLRHDLERHMTSLNDAVNENERLRAEIEHYRTALERLASTEAFDVARSVNRYDGELMCRIHYAEGALRTVPTKEGDK